MMEHSEKELNRTRKIQERKHNRKTGFYYSFFTIVLIFCLIQIGYGAILNVGKIIAYQGKMVTLQNLLKQAQMRNQDLKSEKKVVSSDNSLEGIARNNLKMAKEDEVLIIINQKVETPKKSKSKWHFKGFTFNKKQKNQSEEAGEVYVPSEVVEE
jgi:cell division protein FtsB